MNDKLPERYRLSRRSFSRRVVQTASVAVTALKGVSALDAAETLTKPGLNSVAALSADDEAFLEELEKANFHFFWEQTDPQTGLAKDRCNVRGTDHGVVASIAATGFALAALCIGHKRGY